MKVGDLVRTKHKREHRMGCPPLDVLGSGIIIMEGDPHVVVFWNEQYPQEVEHTCFLEVLNESR